MDFRFTGLKVGFWFVASGFKSRLGFYFHVSVGFLGSGLGFRCIDSGFGLWILESGSGFRFVLFRARMGLLGCQVLTFSQTSRWSDQDWVYRVGIRIVCRVGIELLIFGLGF